MENSEKDWFEYNLSVTRHFKLMSIILKHIPSGCINLKSYDQEKEQIGKIANEYASYVQRKERIMFCSIIGTLLGLLIIFI